MKTTKEWRRMFRDSARKTVARESFAVALDDIDELLAVARRLRKQLNESYPLPLARPKWLKELLSESAFLDSEDC